MLSNSVNVDSNSSSSLLSLSSCSLIGLVSGCTDAFYRKSVAPSRTITILGGRREVRLRLTASTGPERRQPFGNQARQFTGGLAFGKTVTVRVCDVGHYGRPSGRPSRRMAGT